MTDAAKKAWVPFARQGAALLDARNYIDAAAAFEQAVAAGGATWQLFADLAIATKHTGDFERSFEAATRSVESGATEGDGVFWNLGIAATALERWDVARTAWRRCGIPVPDVAGEVRMYLGLVPVRLEPRKDKETVWCERICPARAVIRSVPVTDHRHGDVLLHDGEPRGKVTRRGETYSIFDELFVMELSARLTYFVEVTAPRRGDLVALLAGLEAAHHVVEDWTDGVSLRFGEGSAARWSGARRIGVAALTDPGPALDGWLAKGKGRRVQRLVEPSTALSGAVRQRTKRPP